MSDGATPYGGSRIDFVAYPYLKETARTCDWELATDALASQLGFARGLVEELGARFDSERLRADAESCGVELPTLHSTLEELRLIQLQTWHANGSIRGDCALTEDDVRWLHQRYRTLGALVAARGKGFVLPAGVVAAGCLHVCRTMAKKLGRELTWHRRETGPVPDILWDWSNLLANHLYGLALLVNAATGRDEERFESRSYRVRE